jgi:hypothetical protein
MWTKYPYAAQQVSLLWEPSPLECETRRYTMFLLSLFWTFTHGIRWLVIERSIRMENRLESRIAV